MASELHKLQEALAGNYTVEREIGRGGSSTVYLARDNRHQRSVAIKVLSPELASSISGDRFRGEIELAASLAHPNIVPVFDSGRSGDSLFYVMPLVEGETLRARLRRMTRLSIDEAVRVTRDVGEALAYAHARGIVHRDIKPENILLIGEHAVVADFGIARALHQAGAERLTLTGQAVGTPIYMSPEQSSGSGDVDHRTDIYALACVAYEMIGGAPPISGDTPQQVLARKLTTPPPSIRSTGVDVPRSIEAALGRALSLNAEARFATVDDFMAALSKGDDRRVDRRWVRPTALALGTVGVAVLVVMLVMSRPSGARGSGLGLAVFPFRPTVAGATQWSEAIPDLLATQLEGTPGVRVIDPWSLWRSLRAQRGQMARSPDPDEGQRIARTAGARNFVVGSVAQLQDRLMVSVRLYAVGADQPSHTFDVSGPADSLADVVRRASIEVIKRVAIDSAASSSMRIDRALTRSPMALKNWLSARERLRRGQIDSADAAITRSLAYDSMFVLAIVDAITIKSWVQFVSGQAYGGTTELAERAVSLSDSLPPRARLRAEALLASIDTRGPDAARALEGILSVDSLDFDAWRLLDYVTRVYGWQYGKTERDMLEVAERSYRLDTLAADRLMSRAMLAVALEDSNDIVTQLRRFGAVDTSEAPVRGMLRGIEAIRADETQFRELVSENVAAPLPQWVGMVRVLRQSRPDRALVLASATLQSAAAVSKRVPLGTLVQLLSANSRWRAVDSLRTSSAFSSAQGFDRVVDQVAIAAAIAGTLTDSAATRSVARLARDVPPDSALAFFNKHDVWHDGWLIGAFSAMYGDTVLARRWHRAMATLPKGGRPREYSTAIQQDIEARLAGRRGDRSTALAHARVAYDRWDIHTENQLVHLPEPAMRFNLALLLRAAGLPDSAAALFRSLIPPTTWMGFYTARAALELAEIEEAAKQSDDALRHYFMAARLWEASDPDVAALRARAQRGIARLRSG